MGQRLLRDKAYSALLDCFKLKRPVPQFRTPVPPHQDVRESVDWRMADPARQRVDPQPEETIERILAAWHKAMAVVMGSPAL
jgi:hypothetical protein